MASGRTDPTMAANNGSVSTSPFMLKAVSMTTTVKKKSRVP